MELYVVTLSGRNTINSSLDDHTMCSMCAMLRAAPRSHKKSQNPVEMTGLKMWERKIQCTTDSR